MQQHTPKTASSPRPNPNPALKLAHTVILQSVSLNSTRASGRFSSVSFIRFPLCRKGQLTLQPVGHLLKVRNQLKRLGSRHSCRRVLPQRNPPFVCPAPLGGGIAACRSREAPADARHVGTRIEQRKQALVVHGLPHMVGDIAPELAPRSCESILPEYASHGGKAAPAVCPCAESAVRMLRVIVEPRRLPPSSARGSPAIWRAYRPALPAGGGRHPPECNG